MTNINLTKNPKPPSSCKSLINPVLSNPYILFASFASLATFALNIFNPIIHPVILSKDKIMQNEPNFKNTKTNINNYTKSIYKQKPPTAQQKNEPKRTQFRSHTAGIHLFMQNKANLQGGKMNITSYKTNNYNKNPLCQGRKNKPKTNPKQTQSNPQYKNVIASAARQSQPRDTTYAIRENKPNFTPQNLRIWSRPTCEVPMNDGNTTAYSTPSISSAVASAVHLMSAPTPAIVWHPARPKETFCKVLLLKIATPL